MGPLIYRGISQIFAKQSAFFKLSELSDVDIGPADIKIGPEDVDIGPVDVDIGPADVDISPADVEHCWGS